MRDSYITTNTKGGFGSQTVGDAARRIKTTTAVFVSIQRCYDNNQISNKQPKLDNGSKHWSNDNEKNQHWWEKIYTHINKKNKNKKNK